MKKVLITGASGFLGFHLVEEAQKMGFDVYGGVRLNSDTQHLNCKLLYLNYHSHKELELAMEEYRFDYIIHAAAMTRAKSEATYEKVNVEYALNLAHAAAKIENLSGFVFVSSLAAIGPVPYSAAPIHEAQAQHPVTAYGRSKKRAEEVLKEVANLPLKIVRPTAIYGPREKDLEVLFRTIRSGLDVYIGRSPQKLSFIHGRDAARAILQVALLEKTASSEFNLSDGMVYDRYAVADAIRAITGKKALRLHLPLGLVKASAQILQFLYRWSDKLPVLYPERINEVTAENWAVNTSALRTHVKFTPKFTLSAGLEDTFNYTKLT
jgi:nucleoside-diphosphate-sugar epimerase